MGCVDDEEDSAHLSGEDLEDELEAFLTWSAKNLRLDAGDVHVAIVEGNRRAHAIDRDRLFRKRLHDRGLAGVEGAGDEDPREVHRESYEVLERVRDPVRPDALLRHLGDPHRISDDPSAKGGLELDDEIGHAADFDQVPFREGPVDEEETDHRTRGPGSVDELAPQAQHVFLREPVHQELHRVDDDSGRLLGPRRGDDRLTDVLEARDIVDMVPLRAREEELGGRRIDQNEFRRVDRPEPLHFPTSELGRPEEIDIHGAFPRLHALDGEVLAEDSFLGRLVAEQEQRGGSWEAALEAVVEDRNPRLRPRGRRAHRRRRHRLTTVSGNWWKGCQAASTW